MSKTRIGSSSANKDKRELYKRSGSLGKTMPSSNYMLSTLDSVSLDGCIFY